MGQSDAINTNIFHEVGKAIQVLGSEKVLHILKINRDNVTEITEEKREAAYAILAHTCEVFEITIEDFHSTGRKNDRRFAIGVCSFLIERELQLDSRDISYLLKKGHELICMHKKDITELNPRLPADLKILEKIEKITQKIKNKNVKR